MRPFVRRSLRPIALALAILSCRGDGAVGPATGPALDVAAASVPSLIITEIMPDPSRVSDANGEWFEVYNAGAESVDLRNYRIVSAAGLTNTESHTINASVVIEPGEYVVFGNNANTTTNGGVPVAYSYGSSIVLNNGSSTSANEHLSLRVPLPGIDTVDFVSYVQLTPGVTPGPYQPPSGSSRAVLDLTADNTIVSGSNWLTSATPYGAGDRGTPGQPNTGGAPATVTVRVSWVTPGTTFRITASATDDKGKPAATNFTWSSAHPSIATINSTTGVATGVALGIATITATASNGVRGSSPLFVVEPGGVASVTLSINDPAQVPAGYTKPAFPTVRNTSNAVVSPPPTITWSSSNPAVATVSDLGYITGVAPGTAFIQATAPNGVYGTSPFTVIPADAPTTAVYRNHVEFGTPTDDTEDDELVLSKRQYVLSYNEIRGGPNWVSWNINATQFAGVPRCDCFSSDNTLPDDVYHVVDFDYRNSGYDRGHMVQSESRTTTDQENASTFLLTNILPQAGNNNQGPWSKFENYLNDRARNEGKEIYVIAGGEYSAQPATLKDEGKVAIPEFTWKVAVIVGGGEGLAHVTSTSSLKVIAVRMPNTLASAALIRNDEWEKYERSVDLIEAKIGYDLLAALPDDIERIVENRAPAASAGGPYAGAEGSLLAFDGSASADPDGDALTYAWSFGDGGTGTGAKPEHAYADDGIYTAELTVRDAAGATSRATATVTVTNVAPVIADVRPAAPARVGTPAELTIIFSDAGAGDSHTAMVSWGDGNAPTQHTVTAGRAVVSHTYSATGLYDVAVMVSDDDGGSASRQASAQLVVYDPSAGFVTGGGWFESRGETMRRANGNAKVSVGFVARYGGDGETPNGNLEVQAHEQGLSFHADVVEWLVVSGARSTFQGTGTIGGRAGTYSFLVTAIDGDLDGAKGTDQLRVMIWDGGTVIFDNQPGARPGADAGSALGGGSVVLHR